MDNEEIVIVERKNYIEGSNEPQIEKVEYHFKLKSQIVVELEKITGKNIFEIFANMSFTSMQLVLDKCRILPVNVDTNQMMDDLLTVYSLVEISTELIQSIALKSGLVKKAETEEDTDPNA